MTLCGLDVHAGTMRADSKALQRCLLGHSSSCQAAVFAPAELGGHIVGQVGLPVDHPPLATRHSCRSESGGSMQSVKSGIVPAPASSAKATAL